MGYHSKEITRGEFGHFSKIKEEFEELEDAVRSGNPILELCEMADLVGAIEAYSINHYDIYLEDIVRMMECTKSAFEEGSRK